MELIGGEHVLATERFITSLGRFLSHTTVTLTNRRINYERRRRLLGLVPLGVQRDTYPLPNISAVQTATSISWFKLLGVIVLGPLCVALLALLPMDDGLRLLASGLILLYACWVILDAFRASFSVATTGGQHSFLPIALTSKARAQALAEQVNKAIVQLHAPMAPSPR